MTLYFLKKHDLRTAKTDLTHDGIECILNIHGVVVLKYSEAIDDWVSKNSGNHAFLEGLVMWTLNPSSMSANYGGRRIFLDIKDLSYLEG